MMLPLLLVLVVTQAPAVPGETTLVSSCKQRSLSACEALKQINPKKAAEIMRGWEVLKQAEAAGEQEGDDAREDAEEASCGEPDPDDCKGQNHHVISRSIAKELGRHERLRGLYKPRDERFKAKAKDKESHCGYQKWHREVDQEVINWLIARPRATPEQFEKFLREVYTRPAMRERFPHGF